MYHSILSNQGSQDRSQKANLNQLNYRRSAIATQNPKLIDGWLKREGSPLMTTDDFRASLGLTVGRRVKPAGASVSTGLGPEISAIHDQIESDEKKIKMLLAKFEAEAKGIANRIKMKKLQVDTEVSSQREHFQFKDPALQARHAQETQLLHDLRDDCSRTAGPVPAAPSRDRACV
jgi:hypothetical protein